MPQDGSDSTVMVLTMPVCDYGEGRVVLMTSTWYCRWHHRNAALPYVSRSNRCWWRQRGTVDARTVLIAPGRYCGRHDFGSDISVHVMWVINTRVDLYHSTVWPASSQDSMCGARMVPLTPWWLRWRQDGNVDAGMLLMTGNGSAFFILDPNT